VLVLARPRGGLVVEVAAGTHTVTRDRWLRGVRSASSGELGAVEPLRIALHEAPRAGRIKEFVDSCPSPDIALHLDDGERILATGELFKCSDR
jgi:hypothetical protein